MTTARQIRIWPDYTAECYKKLLNIAKQGNEIGLLLVGEVI
jgi:hypothetical protein